MYSDTQKRRGERRGRVEDRGEGWREEDGKGGRMEGGGGRGKREAERDS